MTSDATARDDLVGATIAGHYRVISRLGVGGMGVAYRAWDESQGVPVVIKMPKRVFLEDARFVERFAREIRLMEGLRHPHIVPIVDVGQHVELPYVVMRFLPGGSLSNRRLRDDKGMVRQNTAGMMHLWLPAVAEALDFIHANGVVHRDVKPANIFFDAGWNAYLGDFGIAKVIEESDTFDRENTLTATNMGIGTQEYMGPEQFVPKPVLDGRTDQYALAVMVYEMLAGTRPFTGSTAHLIVEVTTLPVPPLEGHRHDLHRSLLEAVHRGLSKQPGERFPTCSEFAEAVLRDVQPIAEEAGVARLLCPNCSNMLKLPSKAAGHVGSCPRCQSRMKVAEDFGALWLLHEAPEADKSSAGPESASAPEPTPPPFTPVMTSTQVIRAAYAAKKKTSFARIWGMVAAGLLVALLAWNLAPSGSKKTTGPRFGHRPTKAQATLAKEPPSRTRRFPGTIPAKEKDLQDSTASQEILSRPPLLNSIGMKLKLIPPGSFAMGDDQGEEDEKPAHRVSITQPFYIGVHEITNKQWKLVMGDLPSRWQDEDGPVETMTWDSASAFCAKLSQLAAERKAGLTYRLPTSAEWEYACRAGTTTQFSFGDAADVLPEHAWFLDNAGGRTHSVGQKTPNSGGLCDMHGNVWEWCGDWYQDYDREPLVDPKGGTDGPLRVFRGGSWLNPPAFLRSARRPKIVASHIHHDIGLRVVALPDELISPAQQATEPSTAPTPQTVLASAVASDTQREQEDAARRLGCPVEVTNSVGMVLRLVPSGDFLMGDDAGGESERPAHRVGIPKAFYIGSYEVTNAQWKQVMGRVPGTWKDDSRPVETVSWSDADSFCSKLSELAAERQAGRVYRLPTEAEWEYACRAGTTTKYSFGDDEQLIGDFAWVATNSGGRTHPVGLKKPNKWGIYDMHGNVFEWCADWYGEYEKGDANDPQGPTNGTGMVHRGGGIVTPSASCGAGSRFKSRGQADRHNRHGFRIAANTPAFRNAAGSKPAAVQESESSAESSGQRARTYDFTEPDTLQAFRVVGKPLRHKDGLEFAGGEYAAADTKESYSYPIKVTVSAITLPDRNYDYFIALFVSQRENDMRPAHLREGVHIHWGTFSNTRTMVHICGRSTELSHHPLVAGRESNITCVVDRDRTLTLLFNNQEVHRVVLAPHLRLQGAVRCNGGIGHVVYRAMAVKTEVP